MADLCGAAIELDHIFICAAPGAPVADILIDFGLSEGSRNTHTGQGTANRRFFFRNMMLELLWVDDAAEAKAPPARGMRLYERCVRDAANASPFGLALRPASVGDTPASPGFVTWDYRPAYLPEPLCIKAAADTPLTEPLYFYLHFAQRQDAPENAGNEPLEHRRGFREVTAVTVHVRQEENLSPAATALGYLPGISIVKSERHLLEVTFDNGTLGEKTDFLPYLPLAIRW